MILIYILINLQAAKPTVMEKKDHRSRLPNTEKVLLGDEDNDAHNREALNLNPNSEWKGT